VLDSGKGDFVGEGSEAQWFHTFSETELAKVHLARAFIANPEVLVLQRPLANYSAVSGNRGLVLSAIVEYVRQRGLCFSSNERRRPRTCFFSAPGADAAVADVTLNINDDGSVSASTSAQHPTEADATTISDPTRGTPWSSDQCAMETPERSRGPTSTPAAASGCAHGSAYGSESSGYAVRSESGSTETEAPSVLAGGAPMRSVVSSDRRSVGTARTSRMWAPPRLRTDGPGASPSASPSALPSHWVGPVPSTSRVPRKTAGVALSLREGAEAEPAGALMLLAERKRANVARVAAEVARVQRLEAARLRQREVVQRQPVPVMPLRPSRGSSRGPCDWTPRNCALKVRASFFVPRPRANEQ